MVYYNQGDYVMHNKSIIPISLNDISSVERVAIILRQYLLRNYLVNTIFHNVGFPRTLQPYVETITSSCNSILVDTNNDTFRFIKYPDVVVDWKACLSIIMDTPDFCNRSRSNQKEIIKYYENFTDNCDMEALQLQENLKCFEIDCGIKFESWYCNDLQYIQCEHCGATLDCTHIENVIFCADSEYSADELGMDYIKLNFTVQN